MAAGGPLILGSTGRVGRALAQVWPAGQGALWQHRPGAEPAAKEALTWDILQDPAPDLPRGLSGIVQLAGGTGAQALADTGPLAEAACDLGHRLGLPVLIASSQAVYGPGPGPVPEDTPAAPTSDYGRAKLAMEAAVAGRATCLRIGNVAGCDALLLNAAKGRVTLDRLPDGSSPRRSWIGPVSLARALIALLAHPGPLPGRLNLAQPGQVEMAALLRAAGLPFDWRPAPAGVLPDLALDLTRLTGVIPMAPASAEGLIAEARAGGWRPAP